MIKTLSIQEVLARVDSRDCLDLVLTHFTQVLRMLDYEAENVKTYRRKLVTKNTNHGAPTDA